MAGEKGKAISFLKAQYRARVIHREWEYAALGTELRSSKTQRIIMKPTDGSCEVRYLTKLLTAMIEEDKLRDRTYEKSSVSGQSVLRSLPTISTAHTTKLASDAKVELENKHADSLKVQDDPIGAALYDKYNGKIFLDTDDSVVPNRTWKVVDVQYDNIGGSPY